jgi:SWI/SNF-related matrix-associated actin-dependent regulator 1 of chromatin subfamily A
LLRATLESIILSTMTNEPNKYGLNLSDKRLVNTRNGERFVQNAAPTEAFWSAYRADKAQVVSEGYSVTKGANGWSVALWSKVSTKEERNETITLSRATDAEIELKVNPGLAYRPFQKAGIKFGLSHNSMLLGDDMGLGKTVQIIGVVNESGAKRVLIVCPATLRINWAREFLKWSVNPIVLTADTFKHSEETLKLARDAAKRKGDRYSMTIMKAGMGFPVLDERHIVIMNYDIASRYTNEIRSLTWDLLAADEAHMMKSRTTKRKLAILGGETFEKRVDGTKFKVKIAPIQAVRKILATGTPITNRPREIFPLINYLDPLRWGSFYKFAYRYCAAVQTKYGLDTTGASNLAELQTLLRSSIMIRRLKTEVLTELPPKQRQVVALETNGAANVVAAELAAYEKHQAVIADLVAQVELANAADNEAAYRAAVKKLRAAQSVAFEEISKRRHEVALAKVPAVLSFIEDLDSEKLIVFVHHKDVLAQIVAGIKKFSDLEVVTISGDTKLEDRQSAVDRFQKDPKVGFIVGTIGAMNVGVTLTAASQVVFAELDWVPANMLQAEDRANRIGQTNSVLVQHLVFDGSLDSRMSQVLVDKMQVIEAALDKNTIVDVDGPDFVRTFDDKPAVKKFEDKLSAAQKSAALAGLRVLSSVCDGAIEEDTVGFNGADSRIGKALAGQDSLSPKQAALAHKILRKYRRQIPSNIYEVLYV